MRIEKTARITSVVVTAIITALVVTVLCAPEEDRAGLAEIVENLDGQEGLERQIDWDSLPDKVIAWVEVPGTNVDEPIVQASPDSPSAYLYKDALDQGAYGTPYIDCECSVDSRLVMVYGHHMSDGTAFAEFAGFVDEEFAREHSRIIVYKRSGETLNLEVCGADIVNASRERLIINQEDSFEKIVGSADLQLSDPSEAEQLFAFTTCSYQTPNSRTTVFAISRCASSYYNRSLQVRAPILNAKGCASTIPRST